MAKKFEKLSQVKRSDKSLKLIQFRKSFGWSQKRLADEFFVSPGTIALWELSKREIPGPVEKLMEIYSDKKIIKLLVKDSVGDS